MIRTSLLLAAFVVSGCVLDKDDGDGPGDPIVADDDADDDGYPEGEDCDDSNAAVNPGAREVCDAADVDEDCDGLADDADTDVSDAIAAFHDADGDGFGDAASPATVCEVGGGYVTDATDCDDGDATVFPGTVERCDDADVDEDCDGLADNADDVLDASTTVTLYTDLDGDGHGDPDLDIAACDVAPGLVAEGRDCDDGDADVHPGALEYCNGVDDNCDAYFDEDSAADAPTWYRDADGDTYGTAGTTLTQCDEPDGYVANAEDCDDGSRAVKPGATETCNDVDDDCDGTVDPDTSSGAPTWYADADADTWGDAASSRVACDQPAGYVANTTDCDDTTSSVSPSRTEICDAGDVDEDCDGLSDDADSSVSSSSRTTWYRDADGDTYGTSDTRSSACEQPSGYVASSTDCDDGNAAICPAASERCDSANTDEDCDGYADDNDSSTMASTKSTFYVDSDRDGYGSTTAVDRCDAATGYVTGSTDCNDANATVSPGGSEVCDAADTDEDCDGLAEDSDPSITGRTTWYLDDDLDGYGDAGMIAIECDAPSGFIVTGGDCDDEDAAVSPVGTDTCLDGVDQDCDGSDACEYGTSEAAETIIGATGDGLGSALAWAGDVDGDGVGSLWIGAYLNADGGSATGAVYLVDAGSDGDVDSVRTLEYTSPRSGGGRAVASGDWDRDGVEDVVVGMASGSYTYWALGGDTGVASLSGEMGYARKTYSGSGVSFGASVAAGDTDGDGFRDDVLIGAPGYSSSSGGAYLYRNVTGSGSTISGDEAYFVYSSANIDYGAQFGTDVALGDLDGDGFDEMIMGAPGEDRFTSATGTGTVYVFDGAYRGDETSWVSIDATVYAYGIRGTSANTRLGEVVAADGDIDGDGVNDLLIGGDSAVYAGWTMPAYGYGTTTVATADLTVALGVEVSAISAVDLDEDGDSDLTIGSSSEGAVWFFPGSSGLSGSLTGDDAAATFGPGIAGSFGDDLLIVSDWGGDGYPDLLVSAPDDTSAGGSGAVFVFPGTLFGGP